MRAHDADLLERHALDRHEKVTDREDGLGGDGERRAVEQVVRLGDRPDNELSIGRTPKAISPLAVASTTAWNVGRGTSSACGKRRSHAAALCAPSRPG